MKTIKTFLSLALVAMVVSLTSCGNKSNNPADQFAAALDNIAKEVKSFNSEEDFQKIQPSMEEADKIVADNADYELNDKDREVIKEALANFYRSTVTKSFEIANQEISDADLAGMVAIITSTVDNMKTLGQLNEAPSSNNNLQFSETEAIESVEITDSTNWEKAEKLN